MVTVGLAAVQVVLVLVVMLHRRQRLILDSEAVDRVFFLFLCRGGVGRGGVEEEERR